MRQNALVIYLSVLCMVILLTIVSLSNGAGIEAGVVAGIAIASCTTSLIPFFISRHLFKKAETSAHYPNQYKIAGIIVYVFCFPVKIWTVYVTIYLMIHGESRWAFG